MVETRVMDSRRVADARDLKDAEISGGGRSELHNRTSGQRGDSDRRARNAWARHEWYRGSSIGWCSGSFSHAAPIFSTDHAHRPKNARYGMELQKAVGFAIQRRGSGAHWILTGHSVLEVADRCDGGLQAGTRKPPPSLIPGTLLSFSRGFHVSVTLVSTRSA
jgi:hypothetical protein